MNIKSVTKILKYVVMLGNGVFILWITYNGIDEGFRGTTIEKLSYLSLLALLVFNIVLLSRPPQS